jgi:hypothetical protein
LPFETAWFVIGATSHTRFQPNKFAGASTFLSYASPVVI